MTTIVKEVVMRESCCNFCPAIDDGSAVSCLPCYYDVQEMLQQHKVWMCHSDNTKPCVATGLTEVPDGYIKLDETGVIE